MKSETKGLPWTFKGVTAVGDCETAQEVIKKSGLDFTVAKCPIFAQMPAINQLRFDDEINTTDLSFLYGGSKYNSIENSFATYRTDKNIPLGLVKSKYTVVQNRDAFNFFNDAIGTDMANWDTAGCFDNGKRVFISAKLPGTTKVGEKDLIENYLVFTNSHDGSSGVNIMFTPIRMICQNCMPGAIKTAKGQGTFLNFRHTESVHGNINQALEILGFAVKQSEIMEAEFNRISKIKMNDLQVMDYIASIHLNEAEYKAAKQEPNGIQLLFYRDHRTIENVGISTRKVNMLDSTFDYYLNGPGQLETRGSAWGAFNAITGYYSNVANLDGSKRMDSLLYGNAGNVMSKSLSILAA